MGAAGKSKPMINFSRGQTLFTAG